MRHVRNFTPCPGSRKAALTPTTFMNHSGSPRYASACGDRQGYCPVCGRLLTLVKTTDMTRDHKARYAPSYGCPELSGE